MLSHCFSWPEFCCKLLGENTTAKEFRKLANTCHSYERMYSGTICMSKTCTRGLSTTHYRYLVYDGLRSRRWSGAVGIVSTQVTALNLAACSCQTHCYLSSRRASPVYSQHQIVLLADRCTCVWTTCPERLQEDGAAAGNRGRRFDRKPHALSITQPGQH